MDLLNFNIASFLKQVSIFILPFLFAITAHEVSHAYAAYALGDNTAKNMGRLTLNPIAHLDVVGLLFLLITQMFGWAKPVPVDFRIVARKKYGPLIVAAAGPASNFILAVLSAFVLWLFVHLEPAFIPDRVMEPLILMTVASIRINVVLGIFNLLPVLPLDGGRILQNLLPPYAAWQYSKLEPYGMIIVLALVLTGVVRMVFSPLFSTTTLFLIRAATGGIF